MSSIYKKILYATDLAEGAKDIALRAKQIADNFDAELYLIHIVEHVPAAFDNSLVVDVETSLIDNAKNSLLKLAQDILINKNNCFVTTGSTKQQVNEIAADNNIDLIVVGSYGRHGLALLLSSTANAVLDSAPCDVLAIKMSSDNKENSES